MVVVMVVGAAPDAAGAERIHSKEAHQQLGSARFREDGVVLLIMVDHEKTQDQQTSENAGNDLRDRMEIPERTGDRSQ